MNALKEFIVNYWLLIVVAAAAGTIIYRYVSNKLSDVPTEDKFNGVIDIIKGEFMESAEAIETLIKAEKEGGFDKAKEVFAIQIASFVKNSSVLTDAEKAFINSVSVDYIVNELMKEFDNVKSFIESLGNKKDKAKTDTPVVESPLSDAVLTENKPVSTEDAKIATANTDAPIEEKQ